MTDKAPPKQPNQIEQLVAYLDGELNDEQTAAIEKRLRKDPKLRQMAEELDRTWGMLDALEPVAAGDDFSQQTMQTVAATGSELRQRERASISRLLSSLVGGQTLVWFGMGVIGALIGLGIGAIRGMSEESTQAAQLLRQIDMLQRYPEYSVVPDVQSLRELNLPNPDASSQQEAP